MSASRENVRTGPDGEPGLLRITGACVTFGGLRAVDDVSLEVGSGEIVGLVGPNGAGKSTLFGAIAGAVRLSGGSIEFAGRDVTGHGAQRMSSWGVARTFQKVRLFPTMTAEENVLVAARAHHRNAREAHEAVAAALDMAGFTLDPATPATALALADRKRVEIARAVAARPRLLLLDEMLNGLTRQETDALVAAVAELPAAGITVMLVEHVLHVVRSLCDRLAVLHHGKLIATGDPGDVLARDEVIEAWLGRAHEEGAR
ncbi:MULTISPECIES: ABC transporter ATP-binding protein [unclassified Microbispora]|uniref:ABC transporter ATP-binding protein n=1 Tax=Microbispora TaxID=2005 RepID=UPI00143A98BB|nr:MULTISPECIES: ATP-binding cassette domain-containing protein [unclassified Microbispora]NJP27664.1 ATP-binding cassette domain-containing protein [Microbispora sp. CL1-1]